MSPAAQSPVPAVQARVLEAPPKGERIPSGAAQGWERLSGWKRAFQALPLSAETGSVLCVGCNPS